MEMDLGVRLANGLTYRLGTEDICRTVNMGQTGVGYDPMTGDLVRYVVDASKPADGDDRPNEKVDLRDRAGNVFHIRENPQDRGVSINVDMAGWGNPDQNIQIVQGEDNLGNGFVQVRDTAGRATAKAETRLVDANGQGDYATFITSPDGTQTMIQDMDEGGNYKNGDTLIRKGEGPFKSEAILHPTGMTSGEVLQVQGTNVGQVSFLKANANQYSIQSQFGSTQVQGDFRTSTITDGGAFGASDRKYVPDNGRISDSSNYYDWDGTQITNPLW
jgi:hypothetical protein